MRSKTPLWLEKYFTSARWHLSSSHMRLEEEINRKPKIKSQLKNGHTKKRKALKKTHDIKGIYLS